MIFAGLSDDGCQTNVEWSKMAIFRTFDRQILGNFTVEANIIMHHHEVPCGPSNDLDTCDIE